MFKKDIHGKKSQREEVVDEQDDKDDQLRDSREWDRLHPPLLEMIQQRLPIPDYFRFPAACQSWLKVHRDNCSTSYLGSKVPWLTLFKVPLLTNIWPRCHVPLFYNLPEKRAYRIPSMEPALMESYHVMASSFGWLLLKKGLPGMIVRVGEFCFLHPISGEKINLPNYEGGKWSKDVMALSSPPSDPDCMIAVPSSNGFSVCRIGDQMPQWRICRPLSPGDYQADNGIWDVAFYDGMFYGLTFGLDIVILDYNTTEIQTLKMNMDDMEFPRHCISSLASCFVSGGKFMMFRAYDPDLKELSDHPPNIQIRVYIADFGSMTWVRAWSLGERPVFMSVNGSISLDSRSSCLGGGQGDLIYFSNPSIWRICGCQRRSPGNQWCFLEHDLKDGTTRYHPQPVGTELGKSLEFNWVSPSLT